FHGGNVRRVGGSPWVARHRSPYRRLGQHRDRLRADAVEPATTDSGLQLSKFSQVTSARHLWRAPLEILARARPTTGSRSKCPAPDPANAAAGRDVAVAHPIEPSLPALRAR